MKRPSHLQAAEHRPLLPNLRGVAASLALGAALALAPADGARPGESAARASFSVGAVVLARAGIADAEVPATLDISAQDVARGYVELERGARLTVLNTSSVGYALEVLPLRPLFSGIEVRGTGADVSLDANGGSIVQRGRRGPSIPLALGFRFVLAPGIAPGSYPWPLAFSVRPLAANQ
jgi:hypothetical protein